MRITSLGQAVFAVTMIALGVLGFINQSYAAVWQPVPAAVPSHQVLGYLCAFLSLACGIGLLLQRAAPLASPLLLAYLLIWSLLVSLPGIFTAHAAFGSWYSLAEPATMVAAAWVLYATLAPDWDRRSLSFATGATGVRIGRVIFALALIYFGAGHFVFLKPTADDVPAWLPAHVAWAYFTGFAFIAAGLAILVGVCARLAATLAALQIGIFLLLVWIPIVAAPAPKTAFQWSETVISAALTAAACVVADSYRTIPWLAINKR